MIKNCFSNVDDESLIKKLDLNKLEKVNNYFEITYGDKPSRIYIDLDGDLDYDNINEKTFDELNNNIIQKLMTIDDISLLSSSSYKAQKREYDRIKKVEVLKTVLPKLSYRITYINEYCKNSDDMREIITNEKIPMLKDLLTDIIEISKDKCENILNVDMSVYRKKGKMRCVNAYKYDDDPNRINCLLKGEVEDTIISHIPKNCILKEFKKVEIKEKKEKKVVKTEKPIINDNKTYDDILVKILDNLDSKRFNNYGEWFKIACIFVNEGYDLSLFDKYSKESKKYNKASNDAIINKLKKGNGYKIATLYFMLKEDNYEIWKELQSKRTDFWEIMDKFNHTDIAQLFFNMYPNKYIYTNSIWYELNEHNMYREVKDYKTSLFNNISISIQNIIIEQRNLIIPSDEQYMIKNKMIRNNYNKIGDSHFKKGVIESLCGFYNKDDIKFNTDTTLVAFKNKVYDIKIGKFRNIEPSDYITISTNYDAPEEKDEKTRKEIKDLLYSIFEDKEVINYWLTTVGLSLFTNKFESLYIHTGSGRNGKGVLGEILGKVFGDYYYQSDSQLLTGEVKSQTNPTLANCQYARLLVLSEPDDTNAKDYKLKTSLVKQITGGDKITVRDLYKSNITYKPLFTVLLQCNKKPAIDKIDKAIEERLKVIHYPFTFVENPVKECERKKDSSLKDKINSDINFVKEFMMLLLETAYKNYSVNSIKQPKKVIEKNNEYFDENNPVKEFLNDKFTLTNKNEDKMKATLLLDMYNDSGNYPNMSSIKFSDAIQANGIKKVKCNSGTYYVGLKVKMNPVKDEDDENDNNLDL